MIMFHGGASNYNVYGLNEIENIRVGDYVLTHEQRYRRVTEL